MTNLETMILNSLREGMNEQEFLKTLNESYAVAEAAFKAEQEAQKKAAVEAELANRGQKIAEFAQRMLDGTMTAADVAFAFQTFAKQTKVPLSDAVIAEMFNEDSVEVMVTSAVEAAKCFEPLLKMAGTNWDEVLAEITPEQRAKAHASASKTVEDTAKEVRQVIAKPIGQKMTDGDVIKNFLNQIMGA